MKKSRRYQNRPAFTLIECALAAVILVIIVAAAMRVRQYAAVCARRAESQLLAARSAVFLAEAWKGQKGDPLFDPRADTFDEGFTIDRLSSISLLTSDPPESWARALHGRSDVTTAGYYQVRIDDRDYCAELLYGTHPDVPNLRCLHILLVWEDTDNRRYEYYLPTLTQS